MPLGVGVCELLDVGEAVCVPDGVDEVDALAEAVTLPDAVRLAVGVGEGMASPVTFTELKYNTADWLVAPFAARVPQNCVLLSPIDGGTLEERLANGTVVGGITEPGRTVVKAADAEPEPEAVKKTLEGPVAPRSSADTDTVMLAKFVVFVQNT